MVGKGSQLIEGPAVLFARVLSGIGNDIRAAIQRLSEF